MMKLRYIILLFMCMSISSCKSVKRLLDKKEVSVNEMTHKDVQTSETKVNDISTIRIRNKQKISLSPVDHERPIIIVNGEDSTSVYNSDVTLEAQSSREETADKSISEKKGSDNSVHQEKKETKTKHRETEKKGTHPALIWGLILLIALAGLVWYVRKQIPL